MKSIEKIEAVAEALREIDAEKKEVYVKYHNSESCVIQRAGVCTFVKFVCYSDVCGNLECESEDKRFTADCDIHFDFDKKQFFKRTFYTPVEADEEEEEECDNVESLEEYDEMTYFDDNNRVIDDFLQFKADGDFVRIIESLESEFMDLISEIESEKNSFRKRCNTMILSDLIILARVYGMCCIEDLI